MNYTILAAKPLIKVKDHDDPTLEVEIKDLASKVINPDNIYSFKTKIHVVEKEYIARPDLISFAIYGTDRYADIICKINGISNPFELNEGMVILVPDISNVNIVNVGQKSALTTDEYNGNTIMNIQKSNKKSPLDKRRTPGQQLVTDTLYEIDKKNMTVTY